MKIPPPPKKNDRRWKWDNFLSFYGFHNEVLSARKGHKAEKVRWGRACNGEGGISLDVSIQTVGPRTDRAQGEPLQRNWER